MEAYKRSFDEIVESWSTLRKNQENVDFVAVEFAKLLPQTLVVSIDFCTVFHPELLTSEQVERLKDIWRSLRLDRSILQHLDCAFKIDTWDGHYGQALLSGKFIGLLTGKCVGLEKKLLQDEDDLIIQTRIDSLMRLFEMSNSEDATSMIINVFETYRKLLVRDTSMQNKLSGSTIEKLLHYNMVILCHRKQYEHLYSMIKAYPNYRKIHYVMKKCDSLPQMLKSSKINVCEIRIAVACIEELLRCEFEKGRLKQSINMFHLYLSLLIELAYSDELVFASLEKYILMANDMNVISDYYYLASMLLRIKMPNKQSCMMLAMKLISIGLSHDLTYLEEIKYSKRGDTITTSQGEISREEEFIIVYHRMYLAYVNLAMIVPDYGLQRLCFQAASVCEPITNNCEKILEKLPECDPNDYDSSIDPVLLNIRFQLETFHYDFKRKMKLSTTFDKVSNRCYEKLEYFNRRVKFEEELQPLEYPGVEKYLKKQNIEDSNHVSQVADLEKCINDNAEFNKSLSELMKTLQSTFIEKNKHPRLTAEEVFEIVKDVFENSEEVHVTKCKQIFTDLMSIAYTEILNGDFSYWKEQNKIRLGKNISNLEFDWKIDDECGNTNDFSAVDLDEMYQSGTIKVMKLFRKNHCVVDIENVLLFAILEKKMKLIAEEFAYHNKNRNVEWDTPHNQVQAGFLFIINRNHPEFSRLKKLTYTLRKVYHVMEYYLDLYTFDGTPGKYKFLLKYKTYKTKLEVNGVNGIENVESPKKEEPLPQVKKKKPSPPVQSTLVSPPITEFRQNKPKNTKVIMVAASINTTFLVSEELQHFFMQLQTEITGLCNQKVKLDFDKLTDKSSPYKIHATSTEKSLLTFKIKRMRNNLIDPRHITREFELPLHASGEVVILYEYKDIIEYDEFNDNPRVVSTSSIGISGTVIIERLSHNVRFELDVMVDKRQSKLKFIFQGSKSKLKNKPASLNSTPKSMENSLSSPPPSSATTPIKEEIISNVDFLVQKAAPLTDEVPTQSTNFNNYVTTTTSNAYLPSFDTIAPSTSQYIPPQSSVTNHYSTPPSFCQPSTASRETLMYAQNGQNGHVQNNTHLNNVSHSYPPQQQPPVIKEEFIPQVAAPPAQEIISPPKKKFEILNVENLTPSKVSMSTTAIVQTNSKKLSFGGPPKEIFRNGFQKDFEDDLENMIKPAVIPVIPPMLGKVINDAFQAVPKVTSTPVSVIKQLPKTPPESIIIKSDEKFAAVKTQENLTKSPPPLLHYAKPKNSLPERSAISKLPAEMKTPTKAEQKFIPKIAPFISDEPVVVVKNGGKDTNVTEIVDLTEDFDADPIEVDNDSSIRWEVIRKKRANEHVNAVKNPIDIAFVSCSDEPSDLVSITHSRMNIFNHNQKKLKRPISPAEYNTKNVKIRVVDVMKGLKQENLKKNSTISLIPVINNSNNISNNYVARIEPADEDPLEEYAKDLFETEFTIIGFNSVSYYFNDLKLTNGDGIAKTVDDKNCNNCKICTKSTLNNTKNTNVNTEKWKKVISPLLNVDLEKVSYSDRNHLNFSKNMKNHLKFDTRVSPKKVDNNINYKFNDKKCEDDKMKCSDDDHPLYRMSHEILNSLPGMNSFEFFAFPSRIPRRALQIEVVHLKDLKATASSSTSPSNSAVVETNDLNDSAHNEPGNSSMHGEVNAVNGDISSVNSTIHVQKIGQTSITSDSKTLQTSFGTIIKNTYPPATSRDVKNVKTRVEEKKILISDASKNATNVKIIACTSQQSNEISKMTTVNKNQTLINMLTQQVMMPTNSNRHYIITSASKPNDNTNVLSATTSSPQIIRRNVATGQSQLVQILNSPPSNFTMKPLNTIVTTATAITKTTNQVVTVTSSPSTSTNAAELPSSVKQQGLVQFICKTDGKIIHLTPICNNSTSGGGMTKKITYKVDTSGAKGSTIPTILHHANQQIILNNQLRKGENPNILTIIQKQGNVEGDKNKAKSTILGVPSQATSTSSSMSTRSIYEETYAKFIQTPAGTANAADMGLLTISSTPMNVSGTSNSNTFIQKIGKTVIQSSNQILPKFNQAFGKSIFSSSITTSNEQQLQQQQQQMKKVVTNKEIITRSIVNAISPTTVTKITKNELKTETSSQILSLIDNESKIEKHATTSLPTLQSALQGNNLIYARPIGNGKLIASGGNNNVLLTALRSNNSNQSATSNLRIITTMSETPTVASNRATIMTPVRISVPIQIPQLINSVRPQSPGNFRQQIVIATTTPTARQQTPIITSTGHQITTSKLESLLLTPQQQQQSQNQQISQQQSIITVPKQEIEIDAASSKMKIEHKQHQQQQSTPSQSPQKKNVDNSTLEQLREFDMVLEQVLERSSVTPNSVSSPPRPDSANRSSPRKHFSDKRTENKSSSVSVASISPNDSPSSCKSLSGGSCSSKTLPKLQEDEHTAQRILDILANYKEQVRNSPDLNNKPAPRRRANPPTNPPASKRKKVISSTGSIKNSKQFGSSSDVMTDTMGSEEDSSCGMGSGVASTGGSINNSPRGDIDDHTDVSMDNNFYVEDSKREVALSPQSSSSSVATSPAHNKFSVSRRLVMTAAESNKSNSVTGVDTKGGSSSIIFSSSSNVASSITKSSSSASINESIERLAAQGSTTTAVLMPGNYILPMNVLKSGQQLAILSSNNGQKIIAVPANQLACAGNSGGNNSVGTSIILQRYVNQISEGGAGSLSANDKVVLTHSTNELEGNDNQLKSFRLHSSQQGSNTTVALIANSKIAGSSSSSSSSSSQATTDAFYAAVKAAVEGDGDASAANAIEIKQENDSNASFVNDKTLITEIIQQQQQLARNHPQQNFMIKLNEPSDSSIMFVSNNESFNDVKNIKVKTEEMDFAPVVVKEEAVDLQHESDMLNSPMLNTKMEVDENTSSNHAGDDSSQKMQQFQSILSSCLSKQSNSSKNTTRNFLIDPTNKTLMYIDRRQAPIDKEIFNPKSFSEECADLGVDEPIASDLFPEADLLFDSGSPKFDQINPHHEAQIKREVENGEVLLQMNYSHNITEPWLNFDTEDELVDDSHGESGDESNNAKSSLHADF